MNRCFNQNNCGMFPGMNINHMTSVDQMQEQNPNMCSCNDFPKQDYMCQKPVCPTTYKCCPPIVTCSKQVIDQYHVIKQPYVHNYHTEIVHHYVTENEFIPNYSCSEVHVNEPNNTNYPR